MRITGLIAATFIAAVPFIVNRSIPRVTFHPVPSSRAASGSVGEASRLRAHFDSVNVELRHANSSGLRDAQRASRAELIAWLRDYRNAGRFPQNDRFPERAMPFFRDSRGALCAMAYLIARSGRVDLVDRIARTRNNAFIAELADDQQLGRWLDSVGLTASEAARIQPTYGGSGPNESSSVSTGYAVASIVASGAAMTTVGFNLCRPSTASGVVGLLAGGAAILTGLAQTPSEGGRHTVAVTNIVIGASAMALGVRGLVEAANRHARRAPERASGLELAIAPAVVPARRPAFGLVIQARF